ncbi:MAG: hypothetical protein MUO62_10265 [Anaerolineales bacterium]|nr:hypothetical protein [Anaerolineales bacterium]
MSDKLVVIISSGEPGVARTGMLYALNALKHCWMSEVKLIFFGPAQELLTRDAEMQRLLGEYQAQDETAAACKFIADRDQTGESTGALGVEVVYVGSLISGLIQEGYVPLVW